MNSISSVKKEESFVFSYCGCFGFITILPDIDIYLGMEIDLIVWAV